MLLFFLPLVEVIDRLGPVLRREAFPIIRYRDGKKGLRVREINVNFRFAVPQGVGNDVFHDTKHSGGREETVCSGNCPEILIFVWCCSD